MKATILTFLFSGMLVIGGKMTSKKVEAPKKDENFEQFMKEFHETLSKNKEVQIKADKAKEAIVTQTVSRVTEIKQEVQSLKTELNEVKIKLDSAGIDTGSNYNVLAISHYKKN